MANLYHWLTGSQTDVFSSIFLTASNVSIVGSSSRYGSDSAFQIGTTTNAASTLYSGYNASGPDALPNLGTNDATITFWWQPNNSSYGGGNQRHLFQYLPGAAIEIYHNADLSTDSQDDYNIYASFRYGSGSPSKSKFFDIDLTDNPWIKVYASRIGGAFYYTLYDATGSVLLDNDGDQATWSDTTQTGNIYNASGSTPHVRIGGDFAGGQSAGGIYDDIFLTLNHGISTGSLQIDSDGYAKQDPIINSFSTSAASADDGDTVNLSWNVSFGTTLQLLKYVGGILNNTETVTGTSSKSVTITQTVSYKLRATNIYGSSDSSSVEITLNGGNTMAKLSGSSAIPYQLHGGFLGGFVTDGENAFQHLPIMSGSDGSTDMDYLLGRSLNSGFAGVSGSIISALNHLYTEGDFQAGTGVSSAQLGLDIIGVSASHLSFEFEGGSGKLELASNVAGTGLSLASGQLSVDAAQTQITSVGTIATGVWSATDVGVAHGGTGASSAGDARSNLGVAIGSDVQAYDAQLDSLAAFTAAQVVRGIADDNLLTVDAADAADDDYARFTANGIEGRSFSEVRSDLGLVIGTNVQAYDAELLELATMASNTAAALADLSNTEVSVLDGASAGSKVASKAVIYDSIKGVQGDYVSGSVAVSGALGSFGSLTFGGVALTSTATELNLLDGVSGLVQADFTKLAAVDSSAAQLNLLNNGDLVAGDITKLAALDASSAELNLLDGDVAVGSSVTLADTDGFIVDDAGTMKKIPASDILSYIAANDDERVQDIVGAMVSSNTESGISVSYEDGDGTLDFSVDVAAANISSNAVGADAIITNGVGSLEIVADAVNSAKILDGSVTSAQMAEIIDHSAASHAVVLDANAPDSITGLFLKGKNAAGDAATFQVKIDGGLLQLVSVSTPSASGETSANAGGTNGS